jgi:hypothetical protein
MTLGQLGTIIVIGTIVLVFAWIKLFRRKYKHNGNYNFSPGEYILRTAGEQTLPYYKQLEAYGENDDIMTQIAELFADLHGLDMAFDSAVTKPLVSQVVTDAAKCTGTNTREMIILGMLVGIDGDVICNADMKRVFALLHKGRPISEIDATISNDIDDDILDSFRNGDPFALRMKE